MKAKKLKLPFAAALACLLGIFSFIIPAEACTRILYQGSDEIVATGRSMDWVEDIQSNIWCFPRGIKRDGGVNTNTLTWKAKYGSLTVSGYDVGTADGMNEKGLVANMLYLSESEFGKTTQEKPLLSISLWAQYALDNFATVREAVEVLRQEPFRVIAPILLNGSPAQLHLSLSDPSGDSAILEYIKGKLVIHHGKEYTVMTNSPSFDQQLALNSYWESIGGVAFLPGTSRAADRFARASFMLKAVPKKADPHYISALPDRSYLYQAVASVLGVMRSVSVPLGVNTPNEPNIASTLWRTVSDQKNKVYYFDSATSPNAFWISLSDLDFTEGASIKKLTLTGGRVYAGNAFNHLEPSQPYRFLQAAFEKESKGKDDSMRSLNNK